MNFSSCIDSRFSVVVKEGDDICYLGGNENYEFNNLLQCLHVRKEKSGSGENFSIENNFLLESENTALRIFKLFSVLEDQGG